MGASVATDANNGANTGQVDKAYISVIAIVTTVTFIVVMTSRVPSSPICDRPSDDRNDLIGCV